MLKIIIFLLICVSTINTLKAQTNYKKALITNDKLETYSGFIDYREWMKSPSEVAFKRDLNADKEFFNPHNIKSFVIEANQEKYESISFSYEKLNTDGYTPNYSSLSFYANRSKEIYNKTLFLRTLTEGKITLYSFVDNNAQEYFIVKKDQSLICLDYQIIEVGNKVAFFKIFQNQLQMLFSDSNKALFTSNLEYSEKSLIGIIHKYNLAFSTPENTNISKSLGGRKFEIGILSGYSLANLKTTYSTNAFQTDFITIDGTWDSKYKGGAYFNFILPRLRGRFALENELELELCSWEQS